jgi:GNAT superfamily N-acetyltransferase
VAAVTGVGNLVCAPREDRQDALVSPDVTVERFDAREWSDEKLEALFAEGFPAFITADQDAKALIGPVRDSFADLDIALVVDGDTPVAAGWGVPIRWTGSVGDLPSGYTDALRRAVALRAENAEPDTLVICAGVVHPAHKGTGMATSLIGALVDLAGRNGLARVVAPLRPTPKHRYPLADIGEYAAWTRLDGLPFDPWLRLHVRMGARILTVAPASQTMTGTVSEWEEWTRMAFPASGDYVIPDGLAVVRIDREHDRGEYVEPNVWVQHR